jgi:predicted TIM-barrel fold metal-dependent hydrolase
MRSKEQIDMATKNKLQTIDADAHVLETDRTWDYLDSSEQQFRPTTLVNKDNPNHQMWLSDGKVRGLRISALPEDELARISERSGFDVRTPRSSTQLDDVGVRLAHMDELGIDIQILFTTFWLTQVAERAEAEAALCRSYNRWLGEIWSKAGGRLRWACVVPTLSIDVAVRELRDAKENGAVSVMMRSIEGSRLLVDPYFYPLYEEAARLDLAMTVHVSNASPLVVDALTSQYDRAASFLPLRMPTVGSCLVHLMSDIPAAFPTLRWGFIEVSSQWVPWVVKEAKRRAKKQGRTLPGDLFREFNIYVAAETDDDLPMVVSYIGEDNIVMGTDYGHTDISGQIDALARFRADESLSTGLKDKILSHNPTALYGL